jgi:hypothetical protein
MTTTSEITMRAIMAISETKNQENELQTKIRRLQVGQIITVDTISNETYPGTGNDEIPPLLRLRRTPSTYGLASFTVVARTYLVTGRAYSYDDVTNTRELQGVILCPLKENDICVVDATCPYLVTVNGILHIITFVLAVDGVFRDTMVGDSMHVHVTDLQ